MAKNARQRRKAQTHVAKHNEALVSDPSRIAVQGHVRSRTWNDALPDARVPFKWSSKAKRKSSQRFAIEISKTMPDYSR